MKEETNHFSRRDFLVRGGIVLGGTAILGSCSPFQRFVANQITKIPLTSGVKEEEPFIWFEVLADNTIKMYSPKVEMGQGVFTGFAMIAAEELDIELDQMIVESSSTEKGPEDSLGTGGSSSTGTLYQPIREIAATMRETLKIAAASLLNTDLSEIKTEKGYCIKNDGTKISYAEIVEKTEKWKVAKKPRLKPRTEFRYIGKDISRIDLKAKVMGEPIYAIDQEMPDMLYAVTLESPYIGGTLKNVDTSNASAVSGVVRILEEDDYVAVVAKNRFAAEMGLRKINATWDVPKKWQQSDIEKLITVDSVKGVRVQEDGKPESIFKENEENIIASEYRTPLSVHAQMEPNGAIANVTDKDAEIIVGTQWLNRTRGKIAKAINMSEKKISVKNKFLGGGFGRRYFLEKASTAAQISQAIGKPVCVFRTREEEFRNGYYRPNNHHTMRAVIKDNRVEAIEHKQATDSMVFQNVSNTLDKVLGGDYGSALHGAPIKYSFENKATYTYTIRLPFQSGIWRAVGAWLNCFPVESFMDELAVKLEKDPIAFRLEHLNGEEEYHHRLKELIKAVRDKSKWNEPRPSDVGIGFACFEDRETLVATIAEVKIKDGKIKIVKMTSGIDAGTIINPEGVRTQVEGSVMMGISSALYEETVVKDGQFVSTNYHQYPMATLMDTPEIDVVMVEGREQPSGVGEPPLAPIAPAIANAVFNLTGKRLRRIPFNKELQSMS